MAENTKTRLDKISTLLKDRNAIHLKELAEYLNVSEITVRRNVQESTVGLRIVGGHVIKDDSSSHFDLERNLGVRQYTLISESQKYVTEKRRIGQIASGLIEEGDIVFIDGGTTTPFIVEFIPKDLSCTIICYSFNAFMISKQNPNRRVVLLGGEYGRTNQNFFGMDPEILLSDRRISKSFISCRGISSSFGVMDSDSDSIAIKKKVISISQQCFLTADSSKIDKFGATFFAELNQFNALITSGSPEDCHKMKALEQVGIKILS
ncbi:MAG: DeoR/GlpR transcriptional regulator [SAR324 cluster bacterium]|nr:DeoR/GlpR transcriptional regulator [SAR324 cluster bacterium]